MIKSQKSERSKLCEMFQVGKLIRFVVYKNQVELLGRYIKFVSFNSGAGKWRTASEPDAHM